MYDTCQIQKYWEIFSQEIITGSGGEIELTQKDRLNRKAKVQDKNLIKEKETNKNINNSTSKWCIVGT